MPKESATGGRSSAVDASPAAAMQAPKRARLDSVSPPWPPAFRAPDFPPEAGSAFRALLQANPIGLAITTFDEGRYIEVSDSETALTGYTREELVGRRVLDLGFYDDPEDALEMRRLLISRGTVQNYPFRFRKKSGDLRWGLFSANLIEFAGKSCLLSTVSDVTDLRTMERSHKLNEARVLLASESSAVGWWEWEIGNGIVRCNDFYYSMLGYAPQEFPVTYEVWKELLHPEDQRAAIALVEEMLAGAKEAFDIEVRLRRRDGGYHWVRGIGRVFSKGADGLPLQAFGLHVDIHDRKTSEERLRRFNEELERLVRERTAELERSNEELRRETEARRSAEAELRALTEELTQINNALQVVLRKSREESDFQVRRLVNAVHELVLPHIESLRESGLSHRQAVHLDLLQETLRGIALSEIQLLEEVQRRLTPAEFRIARLIRAGKSSKEIGYLLSISPRTVETHRKHIRRKLELRERSQNLKSFLSSLLETAK
ncbi:MAG: PAS domain-containing protein [Desulfobacterales bacterium]